MKILFIPYQFPPDVGGIATSAFRLTKSLLAAGHEVQVAAVASRDVEGLHAMRPVARTYDGVPVHYFKKGTHSAFIVNSLNVLARSFRPDVVHGYHLRDGGYYAVSVAHQLGVPSVASCRGDDVTHNLCARPQSILPIAKALTGLSSVCGSLLQWLRFADPQIAGVTINNGSTQSFSRNESKAAQWRRENGLDASTLAIGTNAVFRWKKGLTYFGQMLRDVSNSELSSLAFVLIGDYTEAESAQLKKIVASAASPTKQRALIEVKRPSPTELAAVLSALDLFAITSIREGMPNTLLEALACGAPIAATPVDGCEEILRAVPSGLSLDPFDPSAGARRIVQALQDRAGLARMSREALAAAQGVFSAERERIDVEHWYASVVSSHPPAR